MLVFSAAQHAVPIYGQYVGQTETAKTVEVRARVKGFIERQAASGVLLVPAFYVAVERLGEWRRRDDLIVLALV